MVQNQPYTLQLQSLDLDSLTPVYSWPNRLWSTLLIYAKKCTGAFQLLPFYSLPALQDPGQSELPKTKQNNKTVSNLGKSEPDSAP